MLLHGQTEFIEKYGEVIGELQARGFTVATFDWRGQGLSSRLTADSRKSHIKDFREYDEDLATFLEQVVKPLGAGAPLGLAHSMGARAVAEGVESQALLVALTHLGCDVAQGYHLGRPMAAEQLRVVLQDDLVPALPVQRADTDRHLTVVTGLTASTA